MMMNFNNCTLCAADLNEAKQEICERCGWDYFFIHHLSDADKLLAFDKQKSFVAELKQVEENIIAHENEKIEISNAIQNTSEIIKIAQKKIDGLNQDINIFNTTLEVKKKLKKEKEEEYEEEQNRVIEIVDKIKEFDTLAKASIHNPKIDTLEIMIKFAPSGAFFHCEIDEKPDILLLLKKESPTQLGIFENVQYAYPITEHLELFKKDIYPWKSIWKFKYDSLRKFIHKGEYYVNFTVAHKKGIRERLTSEDFQRYYKQKF